MITIVLPYIANDLLIHPQVIDGKVYRYVPTRFSKFYKDRVGKQLWEMLREDLGQVFE